MLTDTILRNRYKILKELGRGGFSVTYLAVDMDLPGNPKCVVKQLKTRHSNNTILQIAKKLFDREAQVLYRLGKGHKQIPEMFAHFEENDEFYLVQEFVDGHDLTREIKQRHRLSEEKVIKLLEEILEVLSFVHENNVIHRDIKLRNIMRRREDGKIVLIDFGAVKEIKGLAKNEQGDVNSTLIIGTPGYMPDEQANGKPRLCSDVYAVGMLGIQALTGIPPRELPFNPNNGELIWRDSANVSDRLGEVLTGMVRHHFSQRYQTAAEALKALKSPVPLPPDTSSAYNPPPVTLPSTFHKSRPALLQSLGLVGLMGIGFGLGVFGWNFFQSDSNGNEPVISTEVKDTITTKKINPSVTPQTENNSNPPIFLPSTPKVEASKNKPIFLPFIPFFNDNKVQVKTNRSQSKTTVKKSQPDSPKQNSQPASRRYIPFLLKTQPKNSQDSLPSISIPSSNNQENDNSPTSLPSTSPVEQPEKATSLPSTPEVDKQQISQQNNLESPTSLPAKNAAELENPQQNSAEDNLEPESPTSLPVTTQSGDRQGEDIDSNPQTPLPAVAADSDSEVKDENTEKTAQQQDPTPTSPTTPAIENESPSPQPTATPTPTTSSVVVPTTPPPQISNEENNSYFLTVPTSPTPVPESKNQPTFSPQTTPTPEAEAEAEVEQSTPQASATPTPEISPQPTPTPETEAQVTPQATASPTPEAQVTPQVAATPTPETEAQVTPQVAATPTPETEAQVTPQAAATPNPENKLQLNPFPLPQEQPGLSLERFDI